jgi:hypothetical protein
VRERLIGLSAAPFELEAGLDPRPSRLCLYRFVGDIIGSAGCEARAHYRKRDAALTFEQLMFSVTDAADGLLENFLGGYREESAGGHSVSAESDGPRGERGTTPRLAAAKTPAHSEIHQEQILVVQDIAAVDAGIRHCRVQRQDPVSGLRVRIQ